LRGGAITAVDVIILYKTAGNGILRLSILIIRQKRRCSIAQCFHIILKHHDDDDIMLNSLPEDVFLYSYTYSKCVK